MDQPPAHDRDGIAADRAVVCCLLAGNAATREPGEVERASEVPPHHWIDAADELIKIALDPKVKAYARTQAISESFKILRENVLEAEQRRQLQEIRRTLQSIEDGKAVDV